jgi:lipoyl(octanoyl) transferase
MSSPSLLVADLGTLPYTDALEVQRAVARARIAGTVQEDVLLLVEHPPVVTLGRSTKGQHLTTPAAGLAARGVELYEVERGGDVTFHGPGQLVGYPIVDLKRHRRDLHWYLRQVEEGLIRGLAEVGIAATRNAGLTGVWVGDEPRHAGPGALRKLASIGVHARDWVTWHGFALNVTTDLSYFDLIVPCGISGVTMTSVAEELRPRACHPAAVQAAVARGLAAVFDLVPMNVPAGPLGALAAAGAAR